MGPCNRTAHPRATLTGHPPSRRAHACVWALNLRGGTGAPFSVSTPDSLAVFTNPRIGGHELEKLRVGRWSANASSVDLPGGGAPLELRRVRRNAPATLACGAAMNFLHFFLWTSVVLTKHRSCLRKLALPSVLVGPGASLGQFPRAALHNGRNIVLLGCLRGGSDFFGLVPAYRGRL